MRAVAHIDPAAARIVIDIDTVEQYAELIAALPVSFNLKLGSRTATAAFGQATITAKLTSTKGNDRNETGLKRHARALEILADLGVTIA